MSVNCKLYPFARSRMTLIVCCAPRMDSHEQKRFIYPAFYLFAACPAADGSIIGPLCRRRVVVNPASEFAESSRLLTT